MKKDKRLLFVANVAKEHILKFHIPTIRKLKEEQWIVDVACSMDTNINECDHCWNMKYKRNPISMKTFEGILQLRKILIKNRYDIIYCHTATGSIVARLAIATLKYKPTLIYMAHGFHFYKGAPLKNWLIFYPIEKILSRWTDYLITINREDFELAKMRRMYKKCLYIIPGIGVDFERLQENNNSKDEIRKSLGLNTNDIVMTYIAELIPNKNQGKLIDVLKILNNKYPNIKLMLIGPDHNQGKYLEYAKREGIEDKVIFTGWRNDIGNLLRASDIYVASSINEGFGINLVEAMFCGLPVVAFENRGHKEIIENGKTGYLVKQGNILKMSECIEKVLNKEYEKISKVVKEVAKKYEKSIITDRVVNIINNIYVKESEDEK